MQHGGVAEEPVPSVELFLDGRGSLLRARWDAGRRLLLLSIWRDGRCVATQALDASDTARLSAFLAELGAEVLPAG